MDRKGIQAVLAALEQEQGCKILYACESGSRAWGFDSPDSDYDVRFIYVHPADWYLSIENHRDVIERMLPDDLDVSGWELRKALRLMRKSNPPFYEWLRSPIVYMERPDAVKPLREVAKIAYSPQRCHHHYRSMAVNNMRDYFERAQIPLKKYFYVLRPILACKWIEADLGPAPMEFQEMVDRLIPAGNLRSDIDELLERKQRSSELGLGSRIDSIHAFIHQEMERMESATLPASPLPPTGPIDTYFRKTVAEFDRL